MGIDRDALESKWQSNERELQRLAAMPPLDREFRAKREDELVDRQHAIAWRLGFDTAAQTNSHRWSGMA
jgi:hypothetical protein